MKLVMNMVRRPFKKGEVIFDISEKSDDLYLINTGMVQIESSEGMVLATLAKGEMASILGERERTARAVALETAVIDVIDSKTMRRRLGEADPVLPALVRNLTIRLADANELNERQWQMLKIYNSLSPGDIRLPRCVPVLPSVCDRLHHGKELRDLMDAVVVTHRDAHTAIKPQRIKDIS